MTTGIDVSEHNGVINWDEVKKHIGFAIIRAGYGQGHIDKQFTRNASECTRLHIPFGVYWFSYAYNKEEAKNEAICCMAQVKNMKLDYPIFYDYEEVSYTSAQKSGIKNVNPADLANAFFASLKALNFKYGLYTNINCLNMWYKPIFRNQFFWLASWSETKPNIDCDIWQNSDHGSIAGIGTKVDMNICYTNFLDPKNTINEKTAFDLEWDKQKERYRKLVTQILAGSWGNGTERIHNLSLHGYDATLAQLLVNAELRG